MATPRKRYVDPDVSGGAGNGTSWANAYASLNAAEQAEDDSGGLTTSDEYVEFVCGHNGAAQTTADTAGVTVASAWVTDATRYIHIYTETADRHTGRWCDGNNGTTARYRLTIGTPASPGPEAGAVALTISEENVRVDGLQIAKVGSDANLEGPIYITTVAAGGSSIRISNCILWGDSNTSYSQPCIYINDADATVVLWNDILYSSGGSNSTNSSAVLVGATTNVSLYSCTCVGAYYGIRLANNQTATAKNCYFHGATAATSVGTGATLTTTTCASAGTTLDVDNVAHSTDNFVNVTAGQQNYHITSGSGLKEQGTTLTDDPPGSTALALDIDGDARS